MVASHSKNRPLERIRKALDFLKSKIELEPEKETFSVQHAELSNFSPLLKDVELLEMAFKKILEDSKGNIKVEVRWTDIPFTTATGGKMANCNIWFYVADYQKFLEYQNQVIQVLKNTTDVRHLILADTKLYEEGSPQRYYSFRGKKSLRYKLMIFLATEKTYIETKNLIDLREKRTTTAVIRKTIGQIRDGIEKDLKINADSVIESDGSSGYRIANVTVKNS
jgi:hypothetical protein